MTFSNDHTVHTSSRRLFLKYSLAGAFALGTVPLLGSAGAVSAASAAGGSNILIAYFSRSGNTRTIAEMIQQRTGGDLVQIQTVKPYPDSYEDCVEMARQEQRANAYPEISTVIADISKYTTVFLGYPNWWGTMPRAVFTFLKAYPMEGKTIAPFCTHGGSALGSSEGDIRRLCPKARLVKGLAVRGGSVRSAGKTVDSWLQSIVLYTQMPATEALVLCGTNTCCTHTFGTLYQGPSTTGCQQAE